MATVGFGDVYRYGGRFVGYVLVVSAVAGVFLGGGAYLASEVMSLTDPSLSALSQTRAFVGVGLMAIGALLGLIGFFGLAHKLLTESMELALASHEQDGVLTVEDADVESSDESGAEDDRTDEAGATSESASMHDTPSRQPTPPEPAAAGTSAGDSPPDGPVGGQPSSVDEPVDAGVEPAEQPPVGGEPEPGPAVDDGPAEAADPADAGEASPPEWTPPDPSEFEQPAEEPVDDGSADAVPEDEPVADADTVIETEPADEPHPVDPDELPDDATLADEGVEGFKPGSEDDPLADRLPADEE